MHNRTAVFWLLEYPFGDVMKISNGTTEVIGQVLSYLTAVLFMNR